MADQSHLDILKQGVGAWNSWKERVRSPFPPSVRPDLPEADLSWANLSGAFLAGANLAGADLSGALFPAADLSGADLSGAAFLTQKQLDETKLGDNETQLPPDLKPPAHWNVRTDEQIEES